jgi:hypothetical protein
MLFPADAESHSEMCDRVTPPLFHDAPLALLWLLDQGLLAYFLASLSKYWLI